MFHDTQPATLRDAGNPDPWAPFRIGHDGEIVALLRQLRDGAVPVTLSAPGGAAYTTQLWSLDPSRQQLSFAADDDQPQLQQLVAGDEAVAVAYLDSIKLQFDLHDLLVVHGARSAALQAALPRVLYRFQRRSAYRVRTLERTSPAARLRHPSIPDMLLTLRVVDVSIGGCALFLPMDMPALAPGVRIEGVQFDLDADTRFGAALQIQHLSSFSGSDRGLRVGCEWQGLSGNAERTLQRYIDQTQKRRRALLQL